MEGFYKLDENGNWLFAPNYVYAKDYVLEKDGNREEVDGWKWYDTPPQEYLIWKFNKEFETYKKNHQ
jgi:hypothetical protein